MLLFVGGIIVCVCEEVDRYKGGYYEHFDKYIAALQEKGLWKLHLQEIRSGYYMNAGKAPDGLINVWNITKGDS